MRVINEECKTGFDCYDSFVEAMSDIVVLGKRHPYPEDPPEKTGPCLVWYVYRKARGWIVCLYRNESFGELETHITHWLPVPESLEVTESRGLVFDARSIEGLSISALTLAVGETIVFRWIIHLWFRLTGVWISIKSSWCSPWWRKCDMECAWVPPYGFVPEADCPVHDPLSRLNRRWPWEKR